MLETLTPTQLLNIIMVGVPAAFCFGFAVARLDDFCREIKYMRREARKKRESVKKLYGLDDKYDMPSPAARIKNTSCYQMQKLSHSFRRLGKQITKSSDMDK